MRSRAYRKPKTLAPACRGYIHNPISFMFIKTLYGLFLLVTGSSPVKCDIALIAQLVEHQKDNLAVAAKPLKVRG